MLVEKVGRGAQVESLFVGVPFVAVAYLRAWRQVKCVKSNPNGYTGNKRPSPRQMLGHDFLALTKILLPPSNPIFTKTIQTKATFVKFTIVAVLSHRQEKELNFWLYT